jgi:hypothetical protein
MRNGYALCTESGLASIARTLDAMTVAEQDSLRDQLRVGLHWDVEVTGRLAPGLLVAHSTHCDHFVHAIVITRSSAT